MNEHCIYFQSFVLSNESTLLMYIQLFVSTFEGLTAVDDAVEGAHTLN